MLPNPSVSSCIQDGISNLFLNFLNCTIRWRLPCSLDTFLIKYSRTSLSRTCLFRITAFLKVKIWSQPKHENLTTGKKYCGKEKKSSFPQYFQYTVDSRYLDPSYLDPITYVELISKSQLFSLCIYCISASRMSNFFYVDTSAISSIIFSP